MQTANIPATVRELLDESLHTLTAIGYEEVPGGFALLLRVESISADYDPWVIASFRYDKWEWWTFAGKGEMLGVWERCRRRNYDFTLLEHLAVECSRPGEYALPWVLNPQRTYE